MKAGTFMQSLLWCCTSCGFLRAGGQPTMECPLCEAYKTSFIDTPQHIEAQLRETFGADNTNSAAARAERLRIVREDGYLRTNRVRGRMTEAVHRPSASRQTI